MLMAKSQPTSNPTAPAEYTVVARRYRPQQFADLIGQEHVATSLINALQTGRVAHAYLFTGARGVGKTSAARILAKALNCATGPTATPCDVCESCLAVTTGEDVDVQEIDGASNNKAEEARELRLNVGFRPTRGRYKIYIIDEVHMLSTAAFNVLLKTLEEPPPHVKFIFATTEVQKLPITILSRCQRFDFANVGPSRIFDQLKNIVQREGHEADDDALRLIARRAAGSMRDSQSLLDQLLASASGTLSTELVHSVLGTAGEERVGELAANILAHDAKSALNAIASWSERGLQIGELLDQLIEHWRALMLVNCGGQDLQDLPASPNQREALLRQAGSLSLDTILAGLEVWTACKSRMRGSNHAQVLLEMAVVRLCRLEELLSIGQLARSISQGVALPAVKSSTNAMNTSNSPRGVPSLSRPAADHGEPLKKNALSEHRTPPNSLENQGHHATIPLTESRLAEIWSRLQQDVTERSPLLGSQLKSANSPAIFGPNSLEIRFHSSYSQAYDACAQEMNRAKITESLRRIVGPGAMIKLERVAGPAPTQMTRTTETPARSQAAERRKQLMDLPLFKKASESLGAQIWHVDEAFNPNATRPALPASTDSDDDEAEPNPVLDPDEG